MRAIRALSVDPSLANFGLAKLVIRLDDLAIGIEKLTLFTTEKRANKVVRQNSDDLRRAQEIVEAFHDQAKDCHVCFAEIPTGAQSARAMYAFGLSVGVLASCPIPLIQVQPFETKLATVGTKTASKEEMIEWAVGRFPKADWKPGTGRGKNPIRVNGVVYSPENEHLADAVAVGHAGIRTDEFKRSLVMWRATAPPQVAA